MDDTDQVRWLIRRQPEEEGYEVLEAASGSEALSLLTAPGIRLDLIITDLSMPQMSGKQLGAAATDLRPSAGVLYISAYPSPKGLEGKFLRTRSCMSS